MQDRRQHLGVPGAQHLGLDGCEGFVEEPRARGRVALGLGVGRSRREGPERPVRVARHGLGEVGRRRVGAVAVRRERRRRRRRLLRRLGVAEAAVEDRRRETEQVLVGRRHEPVVGADLAPVRVLARRRRRPCGARARRAGRTETLLEGVVRPGLGALRARRVGVDAARVERVEPRPLVGAVDRRAARRIARDDDPGHFLGELRDHVADRVAEFVADVARLRRARDGVRFELRHDVAVRRRRRRRGAPERRRRSATASRVPAAEPRGGGASGRGVRVRLVVRGVVVVVSSGDAAASSASAGAWRRETGSGAGAAARASTTAVTPSAPP